MRLQHEGGEAVHVGSAIPNGGTDVPKLEQSHRNITQKGTAVSLGHASCTLMLIDG